MLHSSLRAVIITANNTPDKRIISKISFEYTNTPSDHPALPGRNAQICTKYCTKAFGGRGPTDELTVLPGHSWINGRERSGEGRKGKRGKGRKVKRNMKEEKGGKRRMLSPPFRFSGYAHE